jgi:hypothetical protein
MKHTIRVFAAALLMIFITSLVFAQESEEKAPIETEKKGLGVRYTYEGKPIKRLADFYPIMEGNPEAIAQINKAKTNRGVSSGFAVAGGLLLGWPLGQALAGAEDPNWALAGVGGGLIVVGAVFGVRSDKQLRNGVDIYNDAVALNNIPSSGFAIACNLNSLGATLWF